MFITTKRTPFNLNLRMLYLRAPLSLAKRVLRSIKMQEWERLWRTTPNAQWTKCWFGTIQERKRIKIKTKHDFYLTQILTNHGNFKSFRNKINVSPSALCACGVEQTAQHLFQDCPLTADTRLELYVRCLHQGISTHPLCRVLEVCLEALLRVAEKLCKFNF